MVMWYWSVAILFWQLSIDHIVNVQYTRCGLAKTRLRHLSLPFDGLPYPTPTICRRVRTLGQSRDNQTKRGWPYTMSMGLCPTRASRVWEPRYKSCTSSFNSLHRSDFVSTKCLLRNDRLPSNYVIFRPYQRKLNYSLNVIKDVNIVHRGVR